MRRLLHRGDSGVSCCSRGGCSGSAGCRMLEVNLLGAVRCACRIFYCNANMLTGSLPSTLGALRNLTCVTHTSRTRDLLTPVPTDAGRWLLLVAGCGSLVVAGRRGAGDCAMCTVCAPHRVCLPHRSLTDWLGDTGSEHPDLMQCPGLWHACVERAC